MAQKGLSPQLRELLKSVSRSFYLSMVFLPKEMRESISLAYMLARATDSVADSSQASQGDRLHILQAMGCAIEGKSTAPQLEDLHQQLSGPFAKAQEKASEAALLGRFQDCLEILQHRPVQERELICKVLHTIIKGQSWDLEFFAQHQEVQSNTDTQNYIYSVAGCVGEFWTNLGILAMGPQKFCPVETEEMMRGAAIRYGNGLQLVNILRDRQEDLANGRSYLCSSPKKWALRASRYLQDGIDYSLRLASLRQRFTALLPALLGLKTLEAIMQRGDEQKLKISRQTVYLSMGYALWLSLWRKK